MPSRSSRIRVLFVANCWYPSRVEPIGGLFVRKHAEAVSAEAEVAVLHVVADPAVAGAPELEWSEADPVPTVRAYVRPAPALPGWGAAVRVLRTRRATLEALTMLRERWGRPEIVHHNVMPPAGTVLALDRALGPVPVVMTEHWSGHLPHTRQPTSWLRGRINAWLVRRAARVLPVSEDLGRAMRDRGYRGRYEVVPNVVDVHLFRPAAEVPPGGPELVHVSVLRALKRVDDLVRAVAFLRSECPGLRLHVVGDGPEKGRLQALAEELDLGDRVCFHGRRAPAEVAEILRGGHCLVLFSDFENSPCVIPEAMACGLPVVAPAVGGIAEHVSSATGELVAAGDVDGLHAALRRMAEHHREYDRAAIRAYAEATFSYESVGRRIVGIYRDILGRRTDG